MQVEPVPLATEIPAEVPLPQAPLSRVIAQIRFPPILSVRKEDSVANFQEALRTDYPYLRKDEVRNIDMGFGQEPRMSESVIWRLSDRHEPAAWRVSLGVDFVALETWGYESRQDFLNRLRTVLESMKTCLRPAEAQRLGLRYIDRLEGEALDRIGDLLQESVLGILQPGDRPLDALRKATVHSMNQTRFLALEGVIQARWGNLPPQATYDPDALRPAGTASWILDLDMFSPTALPFRPDELLAKTEAFAKRIYSVFRLMVTNEFLNFHGGIP